VLLLFHYSSIYEEGKVQKVLSMNKILVFIFLFFFINGTFVTAVNPIFASEIVENSWATKTPMNHARSSLGVVAVDGKIYAIGGYGSGVTSVVGVNECYDPATDTWTTLTSMPTPRANFAIAAYQEKIYCIGGLAYGISSELGRNSYYPISYAIVEVYDTVTDSWSTKKPSPISGEHLRACIVDENFFIINRQGSLFLYDFINDSWTEKTSYPVTDFWTLFFISAVVDNKMLIIDVIKGDDFLPLKLQTKVMIYDSKTDVWSEGTSRSEGTTFFTSASAGATTGVYAPKNVYIFGAERGVERATSYLRTAQFAWVYDPTRDSWSTTEIMPTDRTDFGVAVVDDILYVVGGCTSNDLHSSGTTTTPSAFTEQYVPIGYSSTPLTSDSSINGAFLTDSAVVVIVLTTSIVVLVSLFFYVRQRRKDGK
jgi:N-acetylneuraminic acid mutarotase